MRLFIILSVASLVTFGLMLAANILALPVAFDTQGIGWSAAPFRSLLVTVGSLLQTPLVLAYTIAGNKAVFSVVSIAFLSIIYGAAAAGISVLWRWYRTVHR